MKTEEAKNLVGCCGLYCGLCSKYQSTAPSRCIGCKVGEGRSWCSIWNCCVKKHGYETCAQCSELFRCEIFSRRKIMKDPRWLPAVDNLRIIREGDQEKWLEEQMKRQALLELLLENYNEGRSMSFYSKSCARMPIEMINKAIKETNKKLVNEQDYKSDIKLKAKFLRLVMNYLALKADISLNER